MNPETSIFGVFTPTLLLCALIAYALTGAIKEMLARLGLYRFIWRPALFNLSAFLCLLGASLQLVSRIS
jgi:hypothetical protein